MARIAENTVIVDGQEYKPGDVIPDFKSIKCVDTREPRKYQGLSADVSVLNDVIAKYASGGASCFMSDTGEYYEYDRKEKAWKLITNITERGFDSEKAYGALKHMLKNVTVSDEKIQSAVTNYLTVNPVLPGATTEQAQQIEQNKTDVASLKVETNSLKEDFGKVIDKQENLWTNGNVVNSYKANTQYQSKYYDIQLDDGEYYIQYDNVVGAVAGDVQIFSYGGDATYITGITPPSKSVKFSPKNGGVRIYFFSTLTNGAENDGVSTWSGIKLVKGTNIANPSIKESALPDFYKTLPTVIPKIEEDSKKFILLDDIVVTKKIPNLFTHGDISLSFNTGDSWKKVYFDIPLTEGKTYTFKYNNVKNPIENAGIVQIFPYEKDEGMVGTDIHPQEERTFISPPNGIRLIFWGVMQTSPQENGTTTWSGVELQEGEEIQPEKETIIKESALPKFIQNVKIAESFEIVSNTFSSGESLVLKVSNSKSRNHIGFDATINNMGKITIYYGKDMAFNDCKLTIDSTEVVAYNCTQSWVEMARGTHSLALSHHISVRIDTGNDKKAVISVTDETGKTYELQTEWVCGHGDVVVENENGNYTKCKLTFYPSEYRQKVWAYGDSYFDLWPWICNAKGARHWMIDGFSGRGSTDALKSLKLALKHATPSIVLWCLGMNDPDTETEIENLPLETPGVEHHPHNKRTDILTTDKSITDTDKDFILSNKEKKTLPKDGKGSKTSAPNNINILDINNIPSRTTEQKEVYRKQKQKNRSEKYRDEDVPQILYNEFDSLYGEQENILEDHDICLTMAVIAYYFKQYREHMGEQHIMISTKYANQFMGVIIGDDSPLLKADVEEKDELRFYQDMIDEFFKSDLGQRNGKDFDRHIWLFFSERNQDILCERVKQKWEEEVECQ